MTTIRPLPPVFVWCRWCRAFTLPWSEPMCEKGHIQ